MNRFAARFCGRAIRSSPVKARASTRAHGSIPALRMLVLRGMSGTQTDTHFVPGWQWRARPSKRFRKQRAISRSSCLPVTATFPLHISCLWWSGSRLLPNSCSEMLTFPGYLDDGRGIRPGVKALRPRSGALQRGLDSGLASAMLCLSGECHSIFDGPRPKTATKQPLTWLLCETRPSVEANSHQNSHQIKMATCCRWPISL